MSVAGQPPVAATPEAGAEPGRWRKHALAVGVPRAGRVLPLDLGRLSDPVHDQAQLLRPHQRELRLVRQLRGDVSQRRHRALDHQQPPLARDRAGPRHGDRAHLRRPHRAGQLVGRVQDGRVHADGDLRLRGRHHVANRLHQGARPGRAQRRHLRGEGRVQRVGRPHAGATLDRRRDGHDRVGAHARPACRAGRRGPLRADCDSLRRGPRGRRPGRQAGAAPGRDHRRRVERLQARRRNPGRGRERRARAARRDPRPARRARHHDRQRQDGARTARSRSRTSRTASTGSRSAVARLRRRSQASAGSATSWSRPRS